MLALEQFTTPRDLLLALEAGAGRRLPLSVGGLAGNDDSDSDHDDHDDHVADGDDHAADGDALLRRHWLIDGGVVELSGLPGAGALTVALRLALLARARARATGRPRHLAVVDGTGTVCAPALAHVLHETGATNDSDTDSAFTETLVVRPGRTIDALFGCAQRLVLSGAIAAVVVDAGHLQDLGAAVVAARRLLLAAEERQVFVGLVTSSTARRPLPLPVAARAGVEVAADGRVRLRGLRHRHGLPPPVDVRRPLSVSEAVAFELRAPLPTTATTRPGRPTTMVTTTVRPTLVEVGAWPA